MHSTKQYEHNRSEQLSLSRRSLTQGLNWEKPKWGMTICGSQTSNAKTRIWRRFSRYVVVCQMSARSRHQSGKAGQEVERLE